MAQLSQLLLFDPDPSGLDTLTYGFEKDGCSVTGTADANKARDLAQSAAPSLVLVHLRASDKPGDDQQQQQQQQSPPQGDRLQDQRDSQQRHQVGLDLIRAITTNPRTRNLACVAIGRDDSRAAALAAGAFAFLSVPLFVRDVISVCRMVTAAAVPGSRPSPDAELTLTVQDVDGIYFLVRALAVTGRSAVIEARLGQRRGELRFMDGTLTSAVAGAVQGLPALHQMLLWEDGELHFKFKNVVRRGTQLSMKGGSVLEECDVFLRDFAHEAKEIGVARTIYSADLARVQPSAALPSEVVPILRLFDGKRDLAQVLDESPFRIFDTLKIIKRFATDGAIQLKTPLPAARADLGPGLSGPGALDYWLQKPAPVLGVELGASGVATNGPTQVGGSRQAVGSGAGVPSARGPSPFVALAGGRDSSSVVEGAVSVGVAPGARARTVTKKNVVDSTVVSPEDVVTPPPALRRVDTPAKPASAVARGEIRVTPVPRARQGLERDRQDGVPTATAQSSVMVDLGDLPTPKPLSSPNPPPVSAHAPVPSVIVAPMTPPPVLVTPAPLPAVIVAPMTPAPVLVAAAPVLAPVVEAPRTPPSAAVPAPAAASAVAVAASPPDGTEPKRHGRSPSDSFNAVESDFFDREADLYKRESVETFDDLDSHLNGTRKR